VVHRIYSDLAVIDVKEQSLEVVRLAPDVDFEYVRQRTEAELTMADIADVKKTA
jgi:acyl CoA:acetate/3-ketoacid CoA transferase beta subunit